MGRNRPQGCDLPKKLHFVLKPWGVVTYGERHVSANCPDGTCGRVFSVGSLHGYPHSLHLFIDSFIPMFSQHAGPQICIMVKSLELSLRSSLFDFFYCWEEHTSFLGAGNVYSDFISDVYKRHLAYKVLRHHERNLMTLWVLSPGFLHSQCRTWTCPQKGGVK